MAFLDIMHISEQRLPDLADLGFVVMDHEGKALNTSAFRYMGLDDFDPEDENPEIGLEDFSIPADPPSWYTQ